jgi:hypothetical protein
MGVSLSTAQIIVPLSWVYNFAVNNWAILISDPNMKIVNDRNPGAFSPMWVCDSPFSTYASQVSLADPPNGFSFL